MSQINLRIHTTSTDYQSSTAHIRPTYNRSEHFNAMLQQYSAVERPPLIRPPLIQPSINPPSINPSVQLRRNEHHPSRRNLLPDLEAASVGSFFDNLIGITMEDRLLQVGLNRSLNRDLDVNKEYCKHNILTISEELYNSQIHDQKNCVICMMDYEENDILTKLKCSHIYHTDCIQEWGRQIIEPHCPICRIIIPYVNNYTPSNSSDDIRTVLNQREIHRNSLAQQLVDDINNSPVINMFPNEIHYEQLPNNEQHYANQAVWNRVRILPFESRFIPNPHNPPDTSLHRLQQEYEQRNIHQMVMVGLLTEDEILNYMDEQQENEDEDSDSRSIDYPDEDEF